MPVRLFRYRSCFKSFSFSHSVHSFPLFFSVRFTSNLIITCHAVYKHTSESIFFHRDFGLFRSNDVLLYVYKNSDYQDLSFCLSQINRSERRRAERKSITFCRMDLFVFISLFPRVFFLTTGCIFTAVQPKQQLHHEVEKNVPAFQVS